MFRAAGGSMPLRGPARALASGSAALGPIGAWLYESGRLDAIGLTYHAGLALVVGLALCGLAVGTYAMATRRAPVAGILSAALNLAVGALYGFLLLFFGLGGSR